MPSGDADLPDPEELSGRPPDSSAAPSANLSEPRYARFAGTPPLAALAAVAAITWLIVHRLLLPLLIGQKLAAPTLLLLIAPFALNLAACAGMVALAVGGSDFLRSTELPFMARRLLITALSALLLSTLAVATLLPAGHVSGQHVLVSAAALHMMVVQLAMTAMRVDRTLAGRTSSLLLAGSSLFALASLLLRHLQPLAQSSWASEGIASLHGLGELAYLLTPTACAFVVMPWDKQPASRFARHAGLAAACLMALVFSAAVRLPDALYGHLLYSTLRLEWALERASLGYAIPICLAIGAGVAAMFSRDQRHRQGALGIWLWLAGGYNPLTPARVLLTALGATLLCRAILSLGPLESDKPAS